MKTPFLEYNFNPKTSEISMILNADVQDFTLRIRHYGKLVQLNTVQEITLKISNLEEFIDYISKHYLVNIKEK